MATLDVNIPPDWLRTPDFEKRSELLEARKQDRQALALAIEPPFSCDSKYARSNKIFRDSYRQSGAFVPSPRQQELSLPHPRVTCSGSPTKSALFAKRQHDKRLESLKFEPTEVERLRDIPKVDRLENWWKRPAPGYVEDPTNSAFGKESLRLELARHRKELGPVDPAKIRSPASVDSRRFLREKRRQLADKVTHLTHQLPKDYTGTDSEAVRTSDLNPQERRGVTGASSPESTWALPMSPIQISKVRCSISKATGTSSETKETLFMVHRQERHHAELKRIWCWRARPNACYSTNSRAVSYQHLDPYLLH
ncbi:hypothetical protein V7S43_016049 [Phytophthora oleae]|uniref:Enkurin domain-containing protein n=1 Tax=Phytophthora oleae TaxID=2107226 RepID=A0ABD3EWK7_9STRA